MSAVSACYPDLVSKKAIIALSEKKASSADDYEEAYRRWRQIKPFDIDAANRLTREEIYERKR